MHPQPNLRREIMEAILADEPGQGWGLGPPSGMIYSSSSITGSTLSIFILTSELQITAIGELARPQSLALAGAYN